MANALRNGENSSFSKIWILILVGVALVILYLVWTKEALLWPPLNTEKITPEIVVATLTAFVAVAMAIERAGQFFIQLRLKDKIDAAETKRRNAVLAFNSHNKQMALYQNLAAAGVQSAVNLQEEGLKLAALTSDIKNADEEVDEVEKEANALSLWVSLILSLLVAVGGLHLLESLFVGAPTTEPNTALRTFRGVDILLTAGLLAGGSAGIRSMLDRFNETNPPSE